MTKNWVQKFAWGLSGLASFLAFLAWGQTYSWEFGSAGIYQIFPVLGLIAFSLMWGHYIAAAMRMHYGVDKSALKQYFEITSALVLILILLHPGLLAWQLWLDGEGLPPGSELNYVMPSARWAILFGFIALGVFLLYELRRVYEKTGWWKYVQVLSDIAMVMIFFHGLKLGGALQLGWYRGIWYFYGLTFAVALAYLYLQKHRSNRLQS